MIEACLQGESAAVLRWREEWGAVLCKPEHVPDSDGYTEAVFVTDTAEESVTLAYIAEQVEQVGGGAEESAPVNFL